MVLFCPIVAVLIATDIHVIDQIAKFLRTAWFNLYWKSTDLLGPTRFLSLLTLAFCFSFILLAITGLANGSSTSWGQRAATAYDSCSRKNQYSGLLLSLLSLSFFFCWRRYDWFLSGIWSNYLDQRRRSNSLRSCWCLHNYCFLSYWRPGTYYDLIRWLNNISFCWCLLFRRRNDRDGNLLNFNLFSSFRRGPWDVFILMPGTTTYFLHLLNRSTRGHHWRLRRRNVSSYYWHEIHVAIVAAIWLTSMLLRMIMNYSLPNAHPRPGVEVWRWQWHLWLWLFS